MPCLWRIADDLLTHDLIERAEREVTVNADDAWVIIESLSMSSSMLSSPVATIKRKGTAMQPQQQVKLSARGRTDRAKYDLSKGLKVHCKVRLQVLMYMV